MKKIAVITYHNSFNYGAALQAYATSKVLEALGYDVRFIDYYPKNLRDFGTLKTTFREAGYKTRNIIKRIALTAVRYPSHKRLRKVFDDFAYNNLPLTRTYLSREDIRNDPPEADIYCTGSDQVWNNFYTHDFDGTFFLDFVPEGKERIALAASFGKESFSEDELGYIKEHVSKYDCITVRENTAKKILEELGIKDVSVIPDPTILADPKVWEDFAEDPKINAPYILVYQLHGDGEALKKAMKYGKEKGIRVIRINTFLHHFRPSCRNILTPDPHKFIGLFRDAEYVFTDSFHGTVFSLIFKRKLAVDMPRKFSDRIETLLKSVEAEGFVLGKLDEWKIKAANADYGIINSNMERYRLRSRKILEKRLTPPGKDA